MPRQILKQRTDGYYKCKYKGKQFYGRTQMEALRERDAYIANEMNGTNPDMMKTCFIDYGRKWVSVYRTGCALQQQKQYLSMIEYANDFFPNGYLADITPMDMQKLSNSLNGYSGSHINKLLHTMKCIFDSAVADGIILRNPMDTIRKPKAKKCEGHRPLEDWERKLVLRTYNEHDFGLAAMTMMYAGLRRGEVLFLDIDRDVDFEKKTITVRGAVSFAEGNQATTTDGKTAAAQRIIPLVKPLELALAGHHGLVLPKEDGGYMSQIGFTRKYESYITFLETKINGCHKRWYGKTKEHKELVAKGEQLPPWQEINIRCHDFRVDFCTRNYDAKIPLKTLQAWMGHSDISMILKVYAKLTRAKEQSDAVDLCKFMENDLVELENESKAGPENLEIVEEFA